jgi:hypothetical protein
MQVTESIEKLIFSFSFRTDFADDSVCGILAGEVPRSNLIIVAAHIMYKRVSGPQEHLYPAVNSQFIFSTLKALFVAQCAREIEHAAPRAPLLRAHLYVLIAPCTAHHAPRTAPRALHRSRAP